MRLDVVFRPFLMRSLTKERESERLQNGLNLRTLTLLYAGRPPGRGATRTKSRFLWAWVMTGRWPESVITPSFFPCCPSLTYILDIVQIGTYVLSYTYIWITSSCGRVVRDFEREPKLGVTFNSDKLGGIDFTKFSKLTICSA